MFDFIYDARDYEVQAFGESWCGPVRYEHMQDTLVASYKKQNGGDGQDCDVFCWAAPSRFYHIIVKPGKNSMGEEQAGYKVGFGSGRANLAAQVAQAIADGMIGFDPIEEPAK